MLHSKQCSSTAGPGAVRTIAGTMDLHLQLEQRMGAFKRVEDAITFQSGFTANTGSIPRWSERAM